MELSILAFFVGLILWSFGFFRGNYFAGFLGFLFWAYGDGIIATITSSVVLSYFSAFACLVSALTALFIAREFITAKDKND